jgi:hypothetical protein
MGFLFSCRVQGTFTNDTNTYIAEQTELLRLVSPGTAAAA